MPCPVQSKNGFKSPNSHSFRTSNTITREGRDRRSERHRDPPLLGSAVADRLTHARYFDRCDMTSVIDAYINCMINDIDIDYRAGAGPARPARPACLAARAQDCLASLIGATITKPKGERNEAFFRPLMAFSHYSVPFIRFIMERATIWYNLRP